MSFAELDDPVDLADVLDGVVEQDYVDGLASGLLVHGLELLLADDFEMGAVVVGDLLVHVLVLHVGVAEVDKDGVVLVLVGALLHVGLVDLLDLVLDQLLEEGPVLEGDQSVVEHSQALVHPGPVDDLLGVLVELVDLVEPLDDLGHVPHVEEVV